MISKMHLSTLLLFGAIVWGFLLFLSGVTVSISWMRPLSTVTGLLLILISVFDLWLWRLPMLRGWFVNHPDIGGTWRTTISSSWLDASTSTNNKIIVGFMIIRQRYSSLSLRLLTSESSSKMIAAQITKSPDGVFQIACIYWNEPRQSFRPKSPIHYGALLLEVNGEPAKSLQGRYWTDRNTMDCTPKSGQIRLGESGGVGCYSA